MALLHRATLVPSKLDLLRGWVPRQPWGAPDLEVVGAYRFDDPADAVGIECHLVRTGTGETLHVPVTYRDAPLDVADAALVGTTRHSVLGERWVYDGCADPVCVQAFVTAIRTGAHGAEEWIDRGSGPELREATTHVTGAGTPGATVPVVDSFAVDEGAEATVITAGAVTLTVLHRLGGGRPGATLTGTWPGRDEPTVLAALTSEETT